MSERKPLLFFPHWSWKIPESAFKEYECVGFHMTDLPYGRGGSPLQNLIACGKKKTVVSAFEITSGIDAGGIYLKRALSLKGSADEIYRRCASLILEEMIPYIVKHKPKPKPQKGKATLFKRRTPAMSKIENLKSLPKLYDFIRMLDAPNYPKAFLEEGAFRFEFNNAVIKEGTIYASVQIRLKTL